MHIYVIEGVLHKEIAMRRRKSSAFVPFPMLLTKNKFSVRNIAFFLFHHAV